MTDVENARTMSPGRYKTNWLLWIVVSLACFLFWFDGIDFVVELFSGRVPFDRLMASVTDFEFIGAVVMSVLVGWLLQCAVVIVLSWRRQRMTKA